MRRGAILFACVLTATSCVTQTILDPEGAFEGVRAQLADCGAGEVRARIVVIHGIGTNSTGYSDYMTSQIAERIGFDPAHVTENSRSRFGAVIKTRHYADSLSRRLVVHELFWRPIIDHERNERLGYDSRPPFDADRVRLNARIKSELMNDRVADSLIYLGPRGREIRAAARDAFGSELGHAGEITIVTHSLGSMIAYDTLVEMACEGSIAAGVDIKLFMLANQLPLLELARPPRAAASGEPTSKLEVVAMSDPNDILSYTFSDDFKERHEQHGNVAVTFENVRVSIAKYAYLGLLANPMSAHTGYYGDSRVIDLIANGWPPPAPDSPNRPE